MTWWRERKKGVVDVCMYEQSLIVLCHMSDHSAEEATGVPIPEPLILTLALKMLNSLKKLNQSWMRMTHPRRRVMGQRVNIRFLAHSALTALTAFWSCQSGQCTCTLEYLELVVGIQVSG